MTRLRDRRDRRILREAARRPVSAGEAERIVTKGLFGSCDPAIHGLRTRAALTRLEAVVEREAGARREVEMIARANFAAQTQTHVAAMDLMEARNHSDLARRLDAAAQGRFGLAGAAIADYLREMFTGGRPLTVAIGEDAFRLRPLTSVSFDGTADSKLVTGLRRCRVRCSALTPLMNFVELLNLKENCLFRRFQSIAPQFQRARV